MKLVHLGKIGGVWKKRWKTKKYGSSLNLKCQPSIILPKSGQFCPRNDSSACHLAPFHTMGHHLSLTNFSLQQPGHTPSTLHIVQNYLHTNLIMPLLCLKNHWVHVSSSKEGPQSHSFTCCTKSFRLCSSLLLSLISPAVLPHKHFRAGCASPFSLFGIPFLNFYPPFRRIVLKCSLLWTAYTPSTPTPAKCL